MCNAEGTMSLVCWLGGSSLPKETDPMTVAGNKEVQKAEEQGQRHKKRSYYH